MTNVVTKPWGKEFLITESGLPYASKIFFMDAGKRISLQYHDKKIETIILISGQTNIIWGDNADNLKTESMIIHQGYTIKPLTIHRFQAITDSYLVEISTPETGTTYRLEDDYGRPDETPDIRNLPNRGWTPPSTNEK